MTHPCRFFRLISLFPQFTHGPKFCKITQSLAYRSLSSAATLQKTALHDYHVEKGGKMVEFAGYSMPVQYKDGVLASHKFCRSDVVCFDVSHMMQTSVKGKHACEFIESLTVCDTAALNENCGSLSVFLTKKGTIIDDLIANKLNNSEFYVVSNAGCSDKDWALLKEQEGIFRDAGKDVKVEVIPKSLLAVQGPKMVELLQPLIGINMSDLPFMTTCVTDIGPFKGLRVTRCGYTGEDGVEISVPDEEAVPLAELLTNQTKTECRMAGLAARDSLRLEAGLCLYGNDIDETTTPAEATLLWLISKRRRAAADFPGADIILEQIKNKSFKKKRIGLIIGGAPARSGAKITLDQSEIGYVTSGSPSPSLNKNVAMGYVNVELSKPGTEVNIEVRGKKYPAVVSKMPFVPTNYFIKK